MDFETDIPELDGDLAETDAALFWRDGRVARRKTLASWVALARNALQADSTGLAFRKSIGTRIASLFSRRGPWLNATDDFGIQPCTSPSHDRAAAVTAMLTHLGAVGGPDVEIEWNPGIYNFHDYRMEIPHNVHFRGHGIGNCPYEVFSGKKKDMRGTIFLFFGTGPRELTQPGLTDMRTSGGHIANPSAFGSNDAYYEFTSFHNDDASRVTGSAATPKPFSACVVLKRGRGAKLDGIRIQLSFDGTMSAAGYQNDYEYGGSYSNLPTTLGSADYDIGLMVDNGMNARVANGAVLGYFKKAGTYLSYMPALTDVDTPGAASYEADNGGEKCVFDNWMSMGWRGLLVRGAEQWAVIGRTSSTLDLPWADNHPFDPTILFGQLRTTTSGTSSMVRFTGTQFVAAAGDQPDILRLTGVTPDPTTITALDPTNPAAAVSPWRSSTQGPAGLVLRDCQINDMCFAGLERVTDIAGSGLGPAACVEISGFKLRNIVIDHCLMRGFDDIWMLLGDCSTVRLANNCSVEAYSVLTAGRGVGKRLIALPNPATNARAPYARGATAVLEVVGQHYWGYIDTRPMYTIQGYSVPTRFNSDSNIDPGLFNPQSSYVPAATLPASLHGAILMGPVGKPVGLGLAKDNQRRLYLDGDGNFYVRNDYKTPGTLINYLKLLMSGGLTQWLHGADSHQFSTEDARLIVQATDSRLRIYDSVSGGVIVDIQPDVIRFFSSAGTELFRLSSNAVVDYAVHTPSAAGTLDIGTTALPYRHGNFVDVWLSNGARIVGCTGSPEGAVSAPIGTIALRADGGAGTTFYVKEAGSSSTGWRAFDVPLNPAGRWRTTSYLYPANLTAFASSTITTGGGMFFLPVMIPESDTLTQIGLPLVTAQAGAAARVGLYTDSDGVPGDLVIDAGEIDLSTGSGTFAARTGLSHAVSAGIYWMAIFLKASSPAITVQRMSGASGQYVQSVTANLATAGAIPRYYSASSPPAYGALPSTAPAVTAATGSDCPVLMIRN